MKHHGFEGKSEHHHREIDVMGHGSPKATHEIHGGKVGVPRELEVGAGPGRASDRIKPEMSKGQFEGGAKTSGKAKGMKVYSEE